MESDYVVRSTTSMRSMLKLGGSGGMPPQENFENYMLLVVISQEIIILLKFCGGHGPSGPPVTTPMRHVTFYIVTSYLLLEPQLASNEAKDGA